MPLHAARICIRYALAYTFSLFIGLSIAGIPIFGIAAPLVILILSIFISQENRGYMIFWLYCVPLPAFFSIIAADRLCLVDLQKRYGKRTYLAMVGGVVGGTTTIALTAYYLSNEAISLFSYNSVIGFLVVGFSGVPAGMLLGALMAASIVDLLRSWQSVRR